MTPDYIRSKAESLRLCTKIERHWWRRGFPWARAWTERIPGHNDPMEYQVRSNVVMTWPVTERARTVEDTA